MKHKFMVGTKEVEVEIPDNYFVLLNPDTLLQSGDLCYSSFSGKFIQSDLNKTVGSVHCAIRPMIIASIEPPTTPGIPPTPPPPHAPATPITLSPGEAILTTEQITKYMQAKDAENAKAKAEYLGYTLTPAQLIELTILIGKLLHHVRTIKLESVPRLQRSAVQQVVKIVGGGK